MRSPLMVKHMFLTWGALSAMVVYVDVTLHYDYKTAEVAGNSRRQLLENSAEFSVDNKIIF